MDTVISVLVLVRRQKHRNQKKKSDNYSMSGVTLLSEPLRSSAAHSHLAPLDRDGLWGPFWPELFYDSMIYVSACVVHSVVHRVVHSYPTYLPWQSSGPAITKAVPTSHLCQGREVGWNVTGEEQQLGLPCSISSKTCLFSQSKYVLTSCATQSIRRESDCIIWVLIPKRCLLLKAAGCGSQLSMFLVQSIIWQSLKSRIGKFQVLVVFILHTRTISSLITSYCVVLVFVFKQGILIFIVPCIAWEFPTQTLHSCSWCWADITASLGCKHLQSKQKPMLSAERWAKKTTVWTKRQYWGQRLWGQRMLGLSFCSMAQKRRWFWWLGSCWEESSF